MINLPLTKIRYVLPSSFIDLMKGIRMVTKLDEIRSGGGTTMVTFFLVGRFRTVFHFDTSGNWSCITLIVFRVAVAVISSSFPLKLLSSPVDKAIAGRKAFLSLVLRPQLTTMERIIRILSNFSLREVFIRKKRKYFGLLPSLFWWEGGIHPTKIFQKMKK